jgi:hypothetical protein
MTDLGNKLVESRNRSPIVLDQMEIDVMNMKELNQANRLYRKCLAGKCPPVVDKHVRVLVKPKVKKFVSKRIQDEKLALIWKEIGRKHRLKFLEAEINELDKKIKIAAGKTHRVANENNFRVIKLAIQDIEDYELKTKKAKMEINHIESQIERVAQRKVELSHQTESEGEISELL